MLRLPVFQRFQMAMKALDSAQLSQCVQVSTRADRGYMLHWVASTCSQRVIPKQVAQDLLNYGANPNMGLKGACEAGEFGWLSYFHRYGANNWNLGLISATRFGHADFVECCLSMGARDIQGALHVLDANKYPHVAAVLRDYTESKNAFVKI